LLKKETYLPNTDEMQDSVNDADDYSDPDLYEPKQSPMRRKEKFRTKDFKSEKKHKNRKRNYRSKIKYDFEF
jgi:hypothetical protein